MADCVGQGRELDGDGDRGRTDPCGGISVEELQRRRAEFRAPERRYTTGVLAKFATSASKGARCIT